MKATNMTSAMSGSDSSLRLSSTERMLMIISIAAATLFGLGPFLLGGTFGAVFGYAGNDSFIYRLGGAATFGYAVAYAMGLRRDDWLPLRLPVIAVLTFALAAIFATGLEILGGKPSFVVYLILVASMGLVALSGYSLSRHSAAPRPAPDLNARVLWFMRIGTLLSAVFGLGPLLLPGLMANLFGFKGTDIIMIRMAGAASLGYAVMGVYALMARDWLEIRLPTVMALVFNGLSFVAAVLALLAGEPLFVTLLIGAASLATAIGSIVVLQRDGKL